MTTSEEIKKLAWLRLEEAEILYENEKYDGAFYLAGYSVELMLKAKICERLGISNLFDESNLQANQIHGIGEIRKSLKTHNLYILLVYSGLLNKFESEKGNNIYLTKINSLLLSKWNENVRYNPIGKITKENLKTILKILSNKSGILKWIEQN